MCVCVYVCGCRYDQEHALVLCRMAGFKEGLVLLYDRLRLYREVMQVRVTHTHTHTHTHAQTHDTHVAAGLVAFLLHAYAAYAKLHVTFVGIHACICVCVCVRVSPTQVHMASRDHTALLAAVLKYGDVSRGGDPQLWVLLLEYLAQQTTDDVEQRVSKIRMSLPPRSTRVRPACDPPCWKAP